MSSEYLLPGAEATTYLREVSALIIAQAFLICEESANEVPPNFATTILRFKLYQSCFVELYLLAIAA